MLTTMVVIWTVVTVMLVALSIHRSIFVIREQDIIFLSKAEAPTKEKYETVFQRLKKLETVLKVFSFTSGILAVVIAAFWLYQKLYS